MEKLLSYNSWKKRVLLTILTTAWLIRCKSRDERNCVGVMVLKVCVIKHLCILKG